MSVRNMSRRLYCMAFFDYVNIVCRSTSFNLPIRISTRRDINFKGKAYNILTNTVYNLFISTSYRKNMNSLSCSVVSIDYA